MTAFKNLWKYKMFKTLDQMQNTLYPSYKSPCIWIASNTDRNVNTFVLWPFELTYHKGWCKTSRPWKCLSRWSVPSCGSVLLSHITMWCRSSVCACTVCQWRQPRQHRERIFYVLDSNDCISVLVNGLLKPLFKRLVCKYCFTSFFCKWSQQRCLIKRKMHTVDQALGSFLPNNEWLLL